MDRDYHYRTCGLSRQHTKIYIKRRLEKKACGSVPPVPVTITTVQKLPKHFGPATIRHPICYNNNHGAGTFAMAATLIIPALTKSQKIQKLFKAQRQTPGISARGSTFRGAHYWPLKKFIILILAFIISGLSNIQDFDNSNQHRTHQVTHPTMAEEQTKITIAGQEEALKDGAGPPRQEDNNVMALQSPQDNPDEMAIQSDDTTPQPGNTANGAAGALQSDDTTPQPGNTANGATGAPDMNSFLALLKTEFKNQNNFNNIPRGNAAHLAKAMYTAASEADVMKWIQDNPKVLQEGGTASLP